MNEYEKLHDQVKQQLADTLKDIHGKPTDPDPRLVHKVIELLLESQKSLIQDIKGEL